MSILTVLPMNKIRFFYETDFLLENKDSIVNWVKNIISEEDKKLLEINYIFCDDKYLLAENIKHLGHDTLTDVITFNYCEGDLVSSDIMISIERVMENSVIFENSFSKELIRVMAHGVLHLIGYNDKTNKEKKLMKKKEDYYISKYYM